MRKVISVLFLLSFFPLFSDDIALKIGGSSFVLAENGEFNKENRYTFDSFMIGPVYYWDLGPVQLYNFISFQQTKKLTFEDALGVDPTNYIENKFFYGLKNNLGVAYSLDYHFIRLKPALYFNIDHFYLKSLSTDEEFIFSTLGNGVSLDLSFAIPKFISIGISGGIAYNYLPLYNRGTDLLYSYSWYICGLLEYRL